MSLVDEYMASSPNGDLTSPWMALAEKEVNAWRIRKGGMGVVTTDETSRVLSPVQISNVMAGAQTYFWRNSVFEAIKSSPPLPDHVIGTDLMPFQSSYHTFESRWELPHDELEQLRDNVVENKENVREDTAFEWFLMIGDPLGIDVYLFCSSYSDPSKSFFQVYRILYGRKYPADFSDRERLCVGVFLSMAAFLRSPSKHIEKTKAPRAVRRRAQLNRVEEESSVNVVTLRQHTYGASEARAGSSVEWKHKWWVSGHFRAQWHPSKQAHEVTWIAPHIKGPENAPLLNKVYNVAR